MAGFNTKGRLHKQIVIPAKNNYATYLNSYRLFLLCLFGLFVTKCEAAVVPELTEQAKEETEILETEIASRSEQSDHEPPVTSSDLPKQIPAPPRPHFASTPHYEQQIARFVWVTPQYNTPYPVAKQV